MHILQEEYLFLCRKDVKSTMDIAGIISLAKYDLERLTEKQKSLYLDRAEFKRKSTRNHDWDSIISTEPEYRKQLNDIKQEKKRLQKEIKIGDRCLKEVLYVGLFVPERVDVYDVKIPKKPWYLKKEEKRFMMRMWMVKSMLRKVRFFLRVEIGAWMIVMSLLQVIRKRYLKRILLKIWQLPRKLFKFEKIIIMKLILLP